MTTNTPSSFSVVRPHKSCWDGLDCPWHACGKWFFCPWVARGIANAHTGKCIAPQNGALQLQEFHQRIDFHLKSFLSAISAVYAAAGALVIFNITFLVHNAAKGIFIDNCISPSCGSVLNSTKPSGSVLNVTGVGCSMEKRCRALSRHSSLLRRKLMRQSGFHRTILPLDC